MAQQWASTITLLYLYVEIQDLDITFQCISPNNKHTNKKSKSKQTYDSQRTTGLLCINRNISMELGMSRFS